MEEDKRNTNSHGVYYCAHPTQGDENERSWPESIPAREWWSSLPLRARVPKCTAVPPKRVFR